MNKSEFAKRMLELELLKRKVEELEGELTTVVLEFGEPQTVGNIKAAYRAGAAIRDHKTPGSDAPQEIIDQFTITKSTISWAKVCKAAEIEPIHKGYGDPSVRFVLIG